MMRYELPLKSTGDWYKYSGTVSFTTHFQPGKGNCLRFYHGKQGFNIACVTVSLAPPAVTEWELTDYFVTSVAGGAAIEGTIVGNLHFETAYCDFAGIDGGRGGEGTVTVYYGTPKEGAGLEVSVNGGDRISLSTDLPPNSRCLCTPCDLIRRTSLYVQEIGRDSLPHSAKTTRGKLDSYLYIILTEGAGTLTCGGAVYSLKAGDQVFLDCHTPYTWQISPDNGWEVRWLHFNGPNMAPLYAYFLKRMISPVFHINDIRLKDYVALHQQLLTVCPDTGLSSELLAANLLNTLVTRLLMLSDELESPGGGQKIDEIRHYLDEHYAEPITLDALSQRFYISKFHMSRQFKRLYGISIINYVIHRRITRSKELLRFSNLSVNEISAAIGIEDSTYFNKLFHKTEGISAGEYRKSWANHM